MVCRALLRQAPWAPAGRACRVLLLDEPTSSCDAAADARVFDALRRHCAGATVLIVAHRLATVLDCDRIVVMENGNVAEAGAPAELLARAGGRLAQMAAQAELL